MSKLCKIWNHDRTVRKAVVAKKIVELLDKGKSKLGFSKKEPVTVVLEADGTQVEDDDYFTTLPNGTRFIILGKHDEWTDAKFTVPRSVDHADGPPKDSGSSQAKGTDDIFQILRQNISNIVTLDPHELDAVVSQAPDQLATCLDVPRSQALRIQAQCQRYLDEQQESQEALELIRLVTDVKRAGSGSQESFPSDSPDGSTSGRPKRKRTTRS